MQRHNDNDEPMNTSSNVSLNSLTVDNPTNTNLKDAMSQKKVMQYKLISRIPDDAQYQFINDKNDSRPGQHYTNL